MDGRVGPVLENSAIHYRDGLADNILRARELLNAEYVDIQFLEFNWLLNEKQ